MEFLGNINYWWIRNRLYLPYAFMFFLGEVQLSSQTKTEVICRGTGAAIRSNNNPSFIVTIVGYHVTRRSSSELWYTFSMKWLKCHLKVKSTKYCLCKTRNNNIIFREETLKSFMYLTCYHLSMEIRLPSTQLFVFICMCVLVSQNNQIHFNMFLHLNQ